MPDPAVRKADIPMQIRAMPLGSLDREKRTAEVVFSTGAGVRRMDWWTGERYIEELSLDPAHVRLGRLNAGGPLLSVHNQWDLRAVVGVIEDGSARIENGQGVARVRFDEGDPEADAAFRKVANRIVRNVSVGYVVHRYEKIDAPQEGGVPTWRAIDWEPVEISLVPVPADAGAQVRSMLPPDVAEKVPTFACEFITPAAAAGSSTTTRNQETTMPDNGTQAVPAADPNAGQQQDVTQARQEAAAAERTRIREITARVRSAGLDDAFLQRMIDDGLSLEIACRHIVDAVAEAKKAPPTNPTRTVEIVEDERVKLRAAVSAAIAHRANPAGDLPNNGAGEFRYLPLSRLAEEVLKREGVRVSGLPVAEIVRRAMQSTSDFAYILADASNKRLRQAYMENVPSYTRWARRAANAPDFKTINVTQLSGAPDLDKVLEGGEFKRGKVSDSKETYSILTYGKILTISRQAIVNDDLSAFDRLPVALAAAARRKENAIVYALLTANGTMTDGGALFNATAITTAGGHANLGTGTGSALSATSLTTMRTAMRVQKGLASEPLNIAPAFLIVPAALEQTAYQNTSANYVPATQSAVSEFRAGGKTALEPIVEAVLDGSSSTAWYAAARPGEVDTVEFCFLDGSEGLYLEQQVGFDIDGVELKARLDFAAAVIDHRGLYKANGS